MSLWGCTPKSPLIDWCSWLCQHHNGSPISMGGQWVSLVKFWIYQVCECSTGWWTMQLRREVCLSIPGFLQWNTLLLRCKTNWFCKSKRIFAQTISSPATSTSTLLLGDLRTTARQWTDPDHSPRKLSSTGWVFGMAGLLIHQPFPGWFQKFQTWMGKDLVVRISLIPTWLLLEKWNWRGWWAESEKTKTFQIARFLLQELSV